jgi:hypothetical protein
VDLWYGISFSKHLTIFGPINDGPEIFGPLYDGPEIFIKTRRFGFFDLCAASKIQSPLSGMSVQRDDTTLTISNVKGIRDLPHIKSPHDAH